MSDFIDDLECPDEAAAPGPEGRRSREMRREVIGRLVAALTETADVSLAMQSQQHHRMILRLTALIRDMTGRIAEADEASFTAIMQEAATLGADIATSARRAVMVHGRVDDNRPLMARTSQRH